ncbi:caspase family protein [Pontibacterium granulatum]|uniref:caspase family protein n=1 Tax=Pontibacterium granulatum TaxID=2036029 RepID=UPI00249C78CA|nr:caspase family protein [Pontibacterium granulatum]MDI3324303.1 caspase family protein [Pontibacterium granulatum]
MQTLGISNRISSLLLVGTLAMACLFSGNALAVKRALLVGVSDYPNLPDNLQLTGPVNDAEIVHATLRQRGFAEDQIQLLVTKEGYPSPTRANILTALGMLAEEAGPDDFIYLHFAGHGSRQPAKQVSNDEADGLDEIFLPSDAKRWNSAIGSVENAIIDDEIALYVDKLRNRGADVWVVFDSCHSGTMTRSAAIPELRYRQAPSDALGIPTQPQTHTAGLQDQQDFERWNATGYKRDQSLQAAFFKSGNAAPPTSRGDLIAFSAAQSTQITPEMRLPRGNPNRRYHGLFTYSLMDVLGSNTQLSYQQLAQKVLARYESIPWRNSQPLFSASNMNATVFGTVGNVAQQFSAQLRGNKVHIRGGHLAMLSEGAEVALFGDATATEEQRLATLIIDQADAVSSSASATGSQSTHWPKTLYARLRKPALKASLKIAPLASRDMDKAAQATLQKQLAAVSQKHGLIELTPPTEADILVSQFAGRFWFLRADQTLPCEQQQISPDAEKRCVKDREPQPLLQTTVPRAAQDVPSTLGNSLLRIARAEHLLNSTSHLSGTQQHLSINFRVKRLDNVQNLPVNIRPKLQHNDEILLDVKNSGREPQDVSILFIDSQYGITLLYPRKGDANRLQPGDSLSFNWHVNVDTVGIEHLVLSSQPGTGVSRDLSELEQPPLQAATRGAHRSKPPHRGGLEIYSWQVVR